MLLVLLVLLVPLRLSVFHEMVFRDFFIFSSIKWGRRLFSLAGPLDASGRAWQKMLKISNDGILTQGLDVQLAVKGILRIFCRALASGHAWRDAGDPASGQLFRRWCEVGRAPVQPQRNMCS